MDCITSIFGIQVKYETWDKQRTLPIYIAKSYEFRIAILNDIRCMVLTPTQELVTLPALKKQIKKIQEVDNVPVVLNLLSISNYRRKNMIENRIPFITEKQVYLPFMGTFLTDEKEAPKEIKKFMLSTHQLVLLYFYHNTDRLYVSDATKCLPFTAMTLSRATKQLEATGLFRITKDGVNKVIESQYDKPMLFEKVKKYFLTPVHKVGYIEKAQVTKDMVLAGESALAEVTMLNQPRVKTYAVWMKCFDKAQLINELIDPDKQVRLELWEYDPKQFSDSKTADKLSVALSFSENTDERIEEAVEELLERVWVK